MSFTPDSVKQLLISEELGDRLSGVNQLRQIEPAIAFELVQTPIKDKDTRVRYAAVSQMSSLGEQNLTISQEILCECLLQDPEPDVQAAAADAMGALKMTQSFSILNKASKENIGFSYKIEFEDKLKKDLLNQSKLGQSAKYALKVFQLNVAAFLQNQISFLT